MKKPIQVVIFLFLTFTLSIHSQKKTALLIIDGEKVTVSEFKKIYEKNLQAIKNEEEKDIRKNLELFINYRLKVKEAYAMKLDTLPSYIREMETYKNQLYSPYLQDKEFTKKLIKDTYFRIQHEVTGKHILIKTKKNVTPQDTLVAYAKIMKLRDRIISGTASFEAVAKEASEDPSAKRNAGNLGYFSAFKMVYPFENVAYKTKVGEISMPFRTRFGYHIITIDNIRKSKGEVEVAHILITDSTSVGKAKIEDVYKKLQQNEKFEDLVTEYSNDIGSKNKGGKLERFGVGRMTKPFENAAFDLKEVNNYSKPIKTHFGWHIIKLLDKYPIKPFEEMKQEVIHKIKRSGRMQLSNKAVLDKLKRKYTISENESAKEILKRKDIRSIPRDSLQNLLFSINNKEIKQLEFIKYIENRRHIPVNILYKMYKDDQIFAYYKENLIHTNPEYAYTLKEYQEGLLLFELMQQKIWNKSVEDTLGLQNYFDKNKGNYKNKALKEVKGKVTNDYQDFLENQWIATLRNKSVIEINKKELSNIIKFYRKKE